jgi:hypothetical protein
LSNKEEKKIKLKMKELFLVDKIDKHLNILLRNIDNDEEGSSIAVSLHGN